MAQNVSKKEKEEENLANKTKQLEALPETPANLKKREELESSIQELRQKIASAKKAIAHDDKIMKSEESATFAQVTQAVDQSKLDSMRGQASAINTNMANGVSYAENANYGEQSKQQSTKAKLDAQGGVEGAVKIDATEASLKAKTQEDVLDAQLKQGDAKDGLDSSTKKLSEATDKLAQVAGDIAGGKTKSDITSVDTANEKYAGGYTQLMGDSASIQSQW